MAYPTVENLIHVIDEFARLTGRNRKTVSFLVFDAGHRLGHLDAGGDLGTKTFRRAMQWLSDNWPVDKPWPEGIERLSPSPRDPDAVPSRKRRMAKGANDGGTD